MADGREGVWLRLADAGWRSASAALQKRVQEGVMRTKSGRHQLEARCARHKHLMVKARHGRPQPGSLLLARPHVALIEDACKIGRVVPVSPRRTLAFMSAAAKPCGEHALAGVRLQRQKDRKTRDLEGKRRRTRVCLDAIASALLVFVDASMHIS
jgi:hypothetical protein